MTTTNSLAEMAEEIFALTVMAWRQRLLSRRQSESDELSETQFLTLDNLIRHKTQTVGELQRAIGVLPAQMSRIIRSLENFEKPLIRCELNQTDKRKIDVTLTPAGRKMYEDFRSGRLSSTIEVLTHLPDHDRQEFVRICREIKKLYEQQAQSAAAD